MSLQQNINNSIYSLAHLNLLQSISKEPKDYKEMRQLIEDINAGKYAMTPEEVKEAEKNNELTLGDKIKLGRELNKAKKEFQERKKIEENEKLMNEVNRLRKAKPKLTADEAELLARENIAKKQAEYEKSRDIRAKKRAKQFERDRKHGKLGF